MTRAELLARMSARELDEWYIVTAHEPLLSQKLDQLFALLCTIIAQANVGKKRRFSVQGFVNKWWRGSRTPKAQSADDMVVALIKATIAMGGTVSKDVMARYGDSNRDTEI